MNDLSRRRYALAVFFFLPGICLASWITRTPAIRDALEVSIAEMGAVLLGLSVGAMAGILAAGWLVGRFGTRAVMMAGSCQVILSMLTLAVGVMVPSAIVVTFALFLFGAGMGICEIAVNMDGAEVETLSSSPLLHALHGCFSLGTVVGASLGTYLNSVSFPVPLHAAMVGSVCIPMIIAAIRYIPAGLGKVSRDAVSAADERTALWADKQVLIIAFIVLAMAFSEGTANDWLPLLMVDEYGLDATVGSFIFLAFASAMTIGRFGGGYLLGRLGRNRVIFLSAVTCSCGIAMAIAGGGVYIAGLAVLFWGVGASLGFPLALSAAGESGPNSAVRVRFVATAGYVAFLVGPPLLGFVGEHFGLRIAIAIVLAMVSLAAVYATSLTKSAVRA